MGQGGQVRGGVQVLSFCRVNLQLGKGVEGVFVGRGVRFFLFFYLKLGFQFEDQFRGVFKIFFGVEIIGVSQGSQLGGVGRVFVFGEGGLRLERIGGSCIFCRQRVCVLELRVFFQERFGESLVLFILFCIFQMEKLLGQVRGRVRGFCGFSYFRRQGYVQLLWRRFEFWFFCGQVRVEVGYLRFLGSSCGRFRCVCGFQQVVAFYNMFFLWVGLVTQFFCVFRRKWFEQVFLMGKEFFRI